MMIFFAGEGRSYAVTYDGEDIPQETAIIFDGADAAVYAHEILHVFGAHDYYEDAEYTADVVQYIKKKYPKEIMLSPQCTEYGIDSVISPVTAYHIGWLDSAKEAEEYEELKR